MTVAATDRKAGPFTNNTSAPIVGPFAFTFKIFALTDVKVVRTTTTSATGTTETLAYGTDYTVSANLTTQDSSPGGSITLTGDAVAGTGSLLQPGYHLTILSAVAYSQLTALTNYDRFNPTTLNEVHDRVVALTQQLKEQNDRTLAIPATSLESPSSVLNAVFNARDTAVQKATEASASATTASTKASEVTAKYNIISPHFTAIDTIGTNISNINAVASNNSNINVVASVASGVATIAGISSSVSTVASLSSSVQLCAQNINQIVAIGNEAAQNEQSTRRALLRAEAIRQEYLNWADSISISNGKVCVTYEQ